MKEQIRKICEASALRMATLPAHHPLYKEIQHAKRKYPKRHASPLHAVMKISKLFEREAEKIDTIKKEPRWKPAIKSIIDSTRAQGIERERNDDSDVKIYTDGSGIDGQIGAAAVLRSGTTQKIARHHLGTTEQHTVYEGESVGQVLAYQLLKEWAAKKARIGRQTVSIAVDNQASIQAHSRRTAQPGSYLTDEIRKMHSNLVDRFPNMDITIRWIPGHEGLNGSEKADEEAKRAAQGGGNDDTGNKRGILRKSTTDQQSSDETRTEQKTSSQNSTCLQHQQKKQQSQRNRPNYAIQQVPESHQQTAQSQRKYLDTDANRTRRNESIPVQVQTCRVTNMPAVRIRRRDGNTLLPTLQEIQNPTSRTLHKVRRQTQSSRIPEEREAHEMGIPIHPRHSKVRRITRKDQGPRRGRRGGTEHHNKRGARGARGGRGMGMRTRAEAKSEDRNTETMQRQVIFKFFFLLFLFSFLHSPLRSSIFSILLNLLLYYIYHQRPLRTPSPQPVLPVHIPHTHTTLYRKTRNGYSVADSVGTSEFGGLMDITYQIR